MLRVGMTLEDQLRHLTRGCSEVITREELATKLEACATSGRALRVKLGVDPTVPHVTLGWAVVLRKLRHFQELGHTACLIIGDFTAMIGDPSGRTKTRPQLSREEVEANVRAVEGQLYKILDRERTEIYYNADWLGKMSFADVISLAAHTTVARILERDDFQKRLEEERPIGLHEILYPLCQGYDSVAINADVELGGNDQKFNNLVGRQLQAHYGQQPQVVMLMPLLIGTDGKEKMSQSLGNYVSVVDEPNEMFGKTMSIPDELIESWFTLCTDVAMEEVERMSKGMAEGSMNPRDVKRRLAAEIVTLYHPGVEPRVPHEFAPGIRGMISGIAVAADEYFVRTFSKREGVEEAEEVRIPADCVQDGQVGIVALLVSLGLAKSNSDGRRLILSGAVSLDGERVMDPAARLAVSSVTGRVLRVGKHRFRRLVG